jgi:hypothetical protein
LVGTVLQDRFSRGMGAAARALGQPYDLYRPDGAFEPLAPARRVLRLWAAFDLGDPGYRRPHGYERGLRGTFDGDCTAVGDYLQGPRGVLFIATLPPLQRPLCVMANDVLDVLRPVGPENPGLNGYGGVREPRLRTVLEGWPGLVLSGGAGAGAAAGAGGGLPDDGGQGLWSMLLPLTPVPIHGSDLMRDRVGRRFLVRSAELTDLGWRLSVRLTGV